MDIGEIIITILISLFGFFEIKGIYLIQVDNWKKRKENRKWLLQ